MEAKYKIGDKVYHASYRSTSKCHPCPDCLGAQKWSVTSPAGTEYQFSCPRCDGGYSGRHELSLHYSEFAPFVQELTIGSVRMDTAADPDRQIEYMCKETGVGSGSVYRECDLLTTEEAARARSEVDCKLKNAEVPHVVESLKRSISVRDYQLSNALISQAQARESKARYIVGDFLNALEQCRDMGEVVALIEKERNPEAA
jgi:hypothetical protein